MLMTWTHEGGGPWFLLFPLLWFAIVFLAISAFRGGWRRPRHEGAEATLGERFAKGDITADEYRQRPREHAHTARLGRRPPIVIASRLPRWGLPSE